MWEVVIEKVSGRPDGIVGTREIFKLKPGIKPSLGLQDFLEKGGVVECTTILCLIREKITCEKITSLYFDKIKAQGFSLSNSEAIPFTLKSCGKGVPVEPGQFGFITNVRDYNMLHRGSGTGENVFCVDIDSKQRPLYIGFGPFFAKPRTLREILDRLHDDTVTESKREGPKIKARINSYKDSPKFWEEQRAAYQEIWEIHKFDGQKIAETIGRFDIAKSQGKAKYQERIEKLQAAIITLEKEANNYFWFCCPGKKQREAREKLKDIRRALNAFEYQRTIIWD